LFSWGINTDIFVEGFRDEIFDTEMVATLGHALSHENNHLINSVVKIFTAAVAQGTLHCFYWILVPKYLQRGFGTRYLTLRCSPHLDVY